METALLLSTYNWPEALKVVLQSVGKQSVFPDEVLIADDGSGPETAAVIKKFQKEYPFPVKHFWQEDDGFRKSEILNKAIAASSADYIIQVDGDCILHKDLVKDHLALAGEGIYIFGSRVNIKPNSVPEVLEKEDPQFSFLSRAIKNKSRNLRIPALRNLYKEKAVFSRKVRGCNLSYWKKDFIAVNGYNEEIKGWGREDSELVLRMINNGISGKRLRYGGIVYHIYHIEKSKDNLERNHQIQEITIRERKTWCENGVDKYINPSA